MQIDIEGLPTEAVNSRTAHMDNMDTQEMLRTINAEDQTVAEAVAQVIPDIARAVDQIVAAFEAGGRLIYIGAGTSGRLGVLDAAECPPTFGVDADLVIGLIAGGQTALVQAVEGAEDEVDTARGDLEKIKLTAKDVVIGLAASGRTPYVMAGLTYARELGARTVAVTCVPHSEVSQAADISIAPSVGPEVIAGSTRMKAGTAQKLVLNMLSTAAMVRLGKVYGNLMVDVRPTNQKLIERAKRMVATAAGVSSVRAEQALTLAGYHPKTAIVMLLRDCTAEQAKKLLTAAKGFIRRALIIDESENQS